MNAAELVQEDVMSAMEEETEEKLERGKGEHSLNSWS